MNANLYLFCERRVLEGRCELYRLNGEIVGCSLRFIATEFRR